MSSCTVRFYLHSTTVQVIRDFHGTVEIQICLFSILCFWPIMPNNVGQGDIFVIVSYSIIRILVITVTVTVNSIKCQLQYDNFLNIFFCSVCLFFSVKYFLQRYISQHLLTFFKPFEKGYIKKIQMHILLLLSIEMFPIIAKVQKMGKEHN